MSEQIELNLSSAKEDKCVYKLNSWTKGNEQGQAQSPRNKRNCLAVCTERKCLETLCAS